MSYDIFSNWEKPCVAAPPKEDFENVEIKKTEAQLPASLKPVPKIQRRRKRKKNTTTKLFAKKTEKSTNMMNEVAPTKKSLYKWYQKMKKSGRFNF